MRLIHTGLDIEAPPQRVWDVLADVAAYGEWNPLLRVVTGALAPGTDLELEYRAPGMTTGHRRVRVLEVVPGARLRWRGGLPVPGLFTSFDDFMIEPLGSDRSRFAHDATFHGLLVPLFVSTVHSAEDGFELMNAALKRRVEPR